LNGTRRLLKGRLYPERTRLREKRGKIRLRKKKGLKPKEKLNGGWGGVQRFMFPPGEEKGRLAGSKRGEGGGGIIGDGGGPGGRKV